MAGPRVQGCAHERSLVEDSVVISAEEKELLARAGSVFGGVFREEAVLIEALLASVGGREAAGKALRGLLESDSWEEKLRGLLPVWRLALDHPEREVRARVLASMRQLAEYQPLSDGGVLRALAHRLADESSEVARAAAHRLWTFARSDTDLTPVLSALEAAKQSAKPNVPFFASLAVAFYRNRTADVEAPPIEPPDGEPDIGEPHRVDASDRYTCSHHPRHPADAEGARRGRGRGYRCGACGSPRTEILFYAGEGCNAGGTYTYEHRCEVCSLYTEYEHDWG